jgi:hypothetical protein
MLGGFLRDNEALWADNERLRNDNEALWEAWAALEQLSEDPQREFAATASAMGLSLTPMVT